MNNFKRWLLQGDWTERIQRWVSLFLQFAIAGLLAGALANGQRLVAFTAAVVLLLTFLPAMVERSLRVHLPVEFTLVTSLFLYASFGLGEVGQFYHRFWWWDLMLHSLSALVFGLIGFLIVYVLYSAHRVVMAPLYVAMVTFCFAVTVGTTWEIFEFLMDWGFGFNMQKSGLVDTMTDLMVDAGGGLVAAVIGYQYVRDGDSLIAERMVRRFVNKNPRLFSHSEKM